MSFYQKKGSAEISEIEEVVISTVGGDFECEGVENKVSEISWDVIWEKENCEVEVVRNGRKLIIRFDDKSNIVKFFGITINATVGSLYKAKIQIPKNVLEKISISTISGSVKANYMAAKMIKITTISGDVSNEDSRSEELTINSKSGGIKLQRIKADKRCALSTLSSDIVSYDMDVTEINCKNKSGDIKIDALSEKAKYLSVDNISGDIAVRNIPPTTKMGTVSGDIMIKNINSAMTLTVGSVSGDVNILTKPIDTQISFSSVSGEPVFKKRQPSFKSKGEYVFGNGEGGSVKIRTVSGDLIFKTEDMPQTTETDGTHEERKEKHNPDAERIVYTYIQGIITLEEAKEMLRILEHSEEAIEELIETMTKEVNSEKSEQKEGSK